MKKIELFLPLAIVLTTLACTHDESRNLPDVSGIQPDFELLRFDNDMFRQDTSDMAGAFANLESRYPDFLPFFLYEVAHDITRPDETPMQAFDGFVKAPQVRRLYDSVQTRYAELGWLEKELAQVFRYHQYYFPGSPAPDVVCAITEFVGDAHMVNDTLLMLGLDMFMGKDFSGYDPDFFPEYLRRQFSREYMSAKAALAMSNYKVGNPEGNRIIDFMINNGKILYVQDLLTPATPDSLKMGYSREQMEGCYANEQNVWARLLDINVLYEPLSDKNQKIVSPSPAAEMVYTEAPGEIGNWIGWQIVKSFVKRNPDIPLQDMLALKDAQQFLEKARYRPQRLNTR